MTPIDDPSWHFVSESKPCTVCNGTGRDRYTLPMKHQPPGRGARNRSQRPATPPASVWPDRNTQNEFQNSPKIHPQTP